MALTAFEMKHLRSLQTKKGRKQEKRFLAEGVRLLEEALAGNYLPQSVLYSPAQMTPRGESLIRAFSGRRVKTQTISARECDRLSDTKTSQGIIALFTFKAVSLEQLLRRGYRRIVVCDGVGDPGNLGTLIRSAAAFHFEAVITTAMSAESTNPKTIRSSMGAFFRLPVIEGPEAGETARILKKSGFTIFSADIAGKPLSDKPLLPDRAALVIGSEAHGAGRELMSAADRRIRIPMSDRTESLNAAMAGTILMYWMNSAERKQG